MIRRADLTLYHGMPGVFWGLLVAALIGLPLLTQLGIVVPSYLDLYSAKTVAAFGGPGEQLNIVTVMLIGIGALAAIVLGATAGSVDYQNGVLRDLALTGRPRWNIIIGRVIGALIMLTVAIVISVVISGPIAYFLAPNSGSVDWGDVARSGAADLPAIVLALLLSCSLALLVGSRGPAIAIYFVFSFLIDNILRALPRVGVWWNKISFSAIENDLRLWIMSGSSNSFDLDVWRVIVTYLCWIAIPLAIGLYRLSRRDL